MPELPEVETIRAQLAPRVEGRRLERAQVLDPRWCAPEPAAAVERELSGRSVVALRRRGKYLVWALEGEVFLVAHLRMTGTLLLDPPAGAPAHTRVVFDLEDGGWGRSQVVWVDPRRFGTGHLLRDAPALEAYLDTRLGMEPFDPDFTAPALRALARGSRAPVKAFLLNQSKIAGVGNIYADEALFRAGVHPLRAVGTLTLAQLEALRAAVVAALRAGIAAKGASIDDFRDVEGARGAFQDEFLVHRRQGEPCPRCASPVVKLVAAGRGTYVCERCQPRPRRRAVRPRGARPGARSGQPRRAR